MKRISIVLGGVALAVSLAGCERSAGESNVRKSDVPAWKGTSSSAYTASGWKATDQTAWEQQLRTRTQGGQNEYSRTAVKQ
jgi:hypothetical protein